MDHERHRKKPVSPSTINPLGHVLQHMVGDPYYGDIDYKGNVDLFIDDEWRKNMRAPRAFDMIYYPQQYDHKSEPLGPDYHEKHEDREDHAATFWLAPEALANKTPQQLDAEVQAMAQALAEKHDIHPFEARTVYPSESFLKEFDHRFCAGVVFAVTRRDADKVEALIQTLHDVRNNPFPDSAILKGRSWEDFFYADTITPEQDIFAIRDVMDASVPNLRPMRAFITPIGIEFTPSMRATKFLSGKWAPTTHQLPRSDYEEWPAQNHMGPCLAIWMSPAFYSEYRKEYQPGDSKAFVKPKLEVLGATLSAMYDAPIAAHFIPTGGLFTHSHALAPGMVVLTTDAAHQHWLKPNGIIAQGLREYMRDPNHLLDAAVDPRYDRKVGGRY